MQEELNVPHDGESDIVPNMTRDSRVKYITYYEDGVSLPGKRTAVWELDKGMCSVGAAAVSARMKNMKI